MSSAAVLPPLRLALGRWRQMGEFYFLAEFRDGVQAVSPSPAGATVARPGALARGIEKIAELTRFGLQLLRCAQMPSGRTLVFNHSGRYRREEDANRPLYISPAFESAGILIFEDKRVALSYGRTVARLDAVCVNRSAEIVGALAAQVCKWRFGVFDRDIVNFYVKRAFWRLTFQLLRPASLLAFVWYGKEAQISAARSLGVESTDVQHGVVYPSHPFYRLDRSAGFPGSEQLRPERCLVYGEYWKRMLVAAGWPAANVKVAGCFIDTRRAQTENVETPFILYTSQPHFHGIIVRHIESILPAVTARGWQIMIALHPSEDGTGYCAILGDKVRIARLDTYDMLRDCVTHVSVSSTLLWEAMIFGKSSHVLEAGRYAPELLGDFLAFGFGRALTFGQFPEPFSLPESPSMEFFFRPDVDRAALAGIDG